MIASLQQNLYFNHVDKLKFSIAVKQEQGQKCPKEYQFKIRKFFDKISYDNKIEQKRYSYIHGSDLYDLNTMTFHFIDKFVYS